MESHQATSTLTRHFWVDNHLMMRIELWCQPQLLISIPFCRSHQDASIRSLENLWNEIPTKIIPIHCHWEDFCDMTAGRYRARMKRNDVQIWPNRQKSIPFCRSHQDASIGSLESFWNEIQIDIISIHSHWEDFSHRPVPCRNAEKWFQSQWKQLKLITFGRSYQDWLVEHLSF